MKRTDLLRVVIVVGTIVMLIAFVVFPEDYPWYSEIMLFNAGLWPWLLAKRALKKTDLSIKTQ